MSTSNRSQFLPQVLVLSLITLLALAAAPAVPGSEAAAQTPVPQSPPVGIAADSPADLESAITRVRSLYFGHDFHHGAAVGEAALERWPESTELEAWTVANLSRSSSSRSTRAEEVVARAESMVESRPDDVWGAIALALALTHVWDPDGKALEASLRPLELAPTLPEAVWVRGVVLHDRRQYQEAATLIEEKGPVVDRQWVELLALKGNAYLGLREDPERVAEGLEILARVREHDPGNVNAHFRAGNNLLRDRRRRDEVAALLERAAALSPGSFVIGGDHWRAISDQPGLEAEEKKALISASAGALLERRGNYPSTLADVALLLGSLGRQHDMEDLIAEGAALQDRVLTEFADTEEAELVLSNRWHRLSASLLHGQVEDTVAARAELSSMLWSFIDRPHHHSQLGDAYQTLFNHAWRDETVSPDTLLFLARGTAEHTDWAPQYLLANGLAERGVHLDAAREFARDGFDAVEEMVSERMEIFDTPGAAADYLDGALANVHAALGYVELKAGDLAAAREAIDRALELKPARTGIQFRAGALAEAEGDLERAAIHYAWGEREERMWTGDDKPNSDALERIYTERHGSMEGYEEFVAATLERDRDRRRQRVADTRIEEPRDLPAIDLEWLDGGRIGADELEDRIVVINFWGVWCGPCVAEAPQIQQLHEKYRDDPGVVFLTVNAFDPDLDDVRTWMVDNEYDWPVLVDDNFVTRYGVNSYPTTWFADREGRIVFEHRGASAAVYEEFVWRVEMLQGEAAATAAGVAAQSNVYTVLLTYKAPGEYPGPNFSPIGTRVPLADVPSGQALPAGAVDPVRRGVIQIGPTQESWIPLLLTATADAPGVFTRLYLDMNRNGDFSDDGPPVVVILSRNEKTGDLRHRFESVELRVLFPDPERSEPYFVNFWMVHGSGEPAPETMIRYSRRSWRSGSVTVNGVPALVAAMDGNNDALYGPGDDWSVVEASMPEASTRVLGWQEARGTDRLMFLQRDADGPDLVLEFRSFAHDGSSITFAVVDYETSKAEDRLADDMVAEERTRPRATTPYIWTEDLDGAMAAAEASGKRIFLYFETDWCGPCHTMDQWIWSDAEVVETLRAGYIGVKLDGDIEMEHVRRYEVVGYPNILIVDPATGAALSSVKGYQSSQLLLDFLRGEGNTP